MENIIEDGWYLVSPKAKGRLSYQENSFIVIIFNAKKYPDYCVSIIGDESEYSLKDIKIIKKLDLNKL